MHFSVLVNTKTNPFLNPDELHRLLDRYQMFDGVVTTGMDLSWRVESTKEDLKEIFQTKKLYNVVTGDIVNTYGTGLPTCFKRNKDTDIPIPTTHVIRVIDTTEYVIAKSIVNDFDSGVFKHKCPEEIYPNILKWWLAEEAPDYLIIEKSVYETKTANEFAADQNLGLYGEILVYDGKDPNEVFTISINNDKGVYDFYTIGGRWKNTLVNAKGEFVNTIKVNEWDTKKHAIVYMTNVITDTISSLGAYGYEDLHRHLKFYRRGRYLKAIEGMDNTVPFDAITVVKNFYKMLIDDAPSTWTTWGIVTEEGYYEKGWQADCEVGAGLTNYEIEFERRIKACSSDSFLTVVDMHY